MINAAYIGISIALDRSVVRGIHQIAKPSGDRRIRVFGHNKAGSILCYKGIWLSGASIWMQLLLNLTSIPIIYIRNHLTGSV